MTQQTPLDALAVNTIRGLSMDAVQAANSGHPGTPMALAALGWTVFTKLRKHDPISPEWADRDRFILSCGHASMLQYALLHLTGYDLSLDDIKQFRQWHSKTPGHPELHDTPGVEVTTGPLGQGIANAVGMAMAEQFLAARFNQPGHTLFDHKVWVIASDGDLMEGVSAEAASMAGHLKLGKIIAYWDDNSITIDGRTDISFTEDVLARYRAYGWHTESVDDGEDIEAILAASRKAEADPRPSLIRVKTIIGFPAPTKKDSPAAHGAPLGAAEIKATKAIMGWPEEPFHVPAELGAARDAAVAAGAKHKAAWDAQLAAYRAAFPELAAQLDVALAQGLPEGWDANLPKFEPSAKGVATRKASATVLNALAKAIPHLVGGSADLAGSNGSELSGLPFYGRVGAGEVPRNINFGVREHAMGSALNGMALHGGMIPFGATFLIFGDYMRPTMRLAALMKLRTRYILTHDSIGLGEDGPTHQPVEQLSTMRAIPGFATFRPGDANETRECWKAALQWEGPAALVLTRQDIPTMDRDVSGTQRGGYILSEAEGGAAQVVIIASGSEVELAIKAQATLAAKGVRARVVSLPCWELFEAQDAAYRDSVMLPDLRARVAVEAGSGFGWERYLGMRGRFVGMKGFGASAPAELLYEKFGITAEAVVEAALAQLS
ncbi:MAG: transketolase [Sandaracinaceae bacterium]|nr:transketolase [Sandaracinaceae bacterium]MBK7151203.1 transketolase [Sandaracinaceae bacterium]MBK7776706.1 transketolase [Sandaracinaceae bacterium]